MTTNSFNTISNYKETYTITLVTPFYVLFVVNCDIQYTALSYGLSNKLRGSNTVPFRRGVRSTITFVV